MTTQREIEMAVLAYSTYSPSDLNELPLGLWARDTALEPISPADGFAAAVYRNGDEIVIAFRGTDEPARMDFQFGNIPAAGGMWSRQVMQAIQVVADVMAADPLAAITFTGHSLGGGPASLMAAFFNRPAVVFDPAPFELTALSRTVTDVLPGPGIVPAIVPSDSAQLPTWDWPLMAMVLYRDAQTNECVIVAKATSCQVWRMCGKPKPPYWEFRLAASAWQEVPLSSSSLGRSANLLHRYQAELTSDHITVEERRRIEAGAMNRMYREIWGDPDQYVCGEGVPGRQ